MTARVYIMAVLIVLCGDSAASAADLGVGIDALRHGDYRAAFRELHPLAIHGDPDAQFRLGTMFALGLGVDRNYGRAASWLRRAAAHGNARAQNDLGVLYILGRGVSPNYKEAARWLRLAAEQGVGAAQLTLASLYQKGTGVAPDAIEAFAWADAASELGEFGAQKLVDAIGKNMTASQINQAMRRAELYEQQYVAPFRHE